MMAKVTKTIVDKDLRDKIFNEIFELSTEAGTITAFTAESGTVYRKVNDRQWGVLITDLNGETRYVRIGAIVAELREDMTAEELMNAEIEEYNKKQEVKAEKAKAKEAKIAKDKARREKEKTEVSAS